MSRGGVVITRLFVLLACCLLLFWGVPAAHAAEPAPAGAVGASIVLRLPPSMPPAAVRALFADLAAKGARPVVVKADPPPAATDAPSKGPGMITANLAATVWTGSVQALAALPRLAEAPQRWVDLVAARGLPRRAAIEFWIVGFAGLLAAPMSGSAVRRVFDRRWPLLAELGLGRLQVAGVRFLIAVASLAAYAMLFWVALPVLGGSNGGHRRSSRPGRRQNGDS